MILESEALAGRTGHDAGRQLLQKLYRQHIGGEMPGILTAERGKPYFDGGSCRFSISHTRRRVFCAIADREVGIDAEELDRDISLGLADKILSPFEKAQYDAAADKRLALLTFWVLKEAAGKLTGDGLRGYPNHTEFSLDDPRVQRIDGCLVAVMTEDEHAV